VYFSSKFRVDNKIYFILPYDQMVTSIVRRETDQIKYMLLSTDSEPLFKKN